MKTTTVVTLAAVGIVLIWGFSALRNDALESQKAYKDAMNRQVERMAKPKMPKPTKEAGEAALAKMRVEDDKVEGVRRYLANTTPKDTRTQTGVYLTFYEKSDIVGAGMQVVYAGEDWIFFNSLVSNCDGVKHEFNFAPDPSGTDLANPTIADLDHLTDLTSITRDTHVGRGGKVYEWASVLILKRNYFEFLYACANAKESTIRLNGKFSHDHKMSPKEKQAILDTFAAFQAKGGSFELP